MSSPARPTRFRLHERSIVIVTDWYDHTSLNPAFLGGRGVIPPEWGTPTLLGAPSPRQLQFSNGVRVEIAPTRVSFHEPCDKPFGAATAEDDSLSLAAQSWVREMPFVPYRHLGLNVVVSGLRQQPHRWIMNRFLRRGVVSEVPYALNGFTAQFAFALDAARCLVNLEAGNIQVHDGKPHDAILLRCNVHHTEIGTVEALDTAIGHWPRRQRQVAGVLDQILGKAK